MKNNEKISIVVPIYNVEEYLPRCLDSIITQTYTNIEIMLVDDGSPDNAGAICDDYAAKDRRIRVFHIPNGGVAKARQLGVENSTGEYIVFVDPDDSLISNSVEVLYSKTSEKIDVVVGSYTIYSADKEKTKYLSNKLYNNSSWVSLMLYNPHITNGAPWAKLYRRSIFKDSSFPNMHRSQDWLMNLEVCMRTSQIATISDVVYSYYIREDSSQVFKPNLPYYIEYTKIASNILKINGMLESNKTAYYHMKLKYVYECILNGNSSDIVFDNLWLSDVYKSTNHYKLTFIQNTVRLSIKYSFLKPVVRYMAKAQRILMKFGFLMYNNKY